MAIVDELGSLTLLGFYYGSLALTMVLRAYRYFPVHPESAIGSFACGFGGHQLILIGII